MDALYSPSHGVAYIKLSTQEIFPIYYNTTSVEFEDGESLDFSSIIYPPTENNYSLALVNGELYAIYADVENNGSIKVEKLDDADNWNDVSYNTTLTNGTEYYEYPTVMTSLNTDNTESIFIYGGLLNNSITSRLLEYNPNSNTLSSVITSVAPTAFYGAARCIMDDQGSSNLIIGGKAGSGWISMFQIATFEYKTWSFKTVSSSDFNINSRVSPLILPIFSQDSNREDTTEVANLLIMGGYLANDLATPYVINLNVTNDWKYSNYSTIGDFTYTSGLIGAVVINETLITINDDSSKRSDGYDINLYDTQSLMRLDKFQYSQSTYISTVLSSSTISTSELSTTASESKSVISELLISDSSTASLSSTIDSASAYFTGTPTNPTDSSRSSRHQSKRTSVIIGVVLAIVGLFVISIIAFLVHKKYFKYNENIELQSSISSSDSEKYFDYYKELNNLDNQSISSWNNKRDEYEKLQRQLTHSTKSIFGKSMDTLQSPLNEPPATPKRNSKVRYSLSPTKSHNINLEDFENNEDIFHTPVTESQYYPPTGQHTFKHAEDQEMDEFLNERDVQVLVSSKRRSKLRITNPDIEVIANEEIDNSNSATSIHFENHHISDGPPTDQGVNEEREFYKKLFEALDNDDDSILS
ncbi:hypothetical protein WICMUC_002064 [Wickerhamomyces mucosus]|uniref:Galactose oxidase n=1 Tax=Wickerhamomyces mucosus TaxID=1378264 RepID=A0A9P8PQG5_9ASCO|nr:hypothetical protein WICMUC_002064 [Wickerhamomyces mucosus]